MRTDECPSDLKMQSIKELHNEAMRLMQCGKEGRTEKILWKPRDISGWRLLARKRPLCNCVFVYDTEPMRSRFFCMAIGLAIRCGKPKEAACLIRYAKESNRREETIRELAGYEQAIKKASSPKKKRRIRLRFRRPK